MKDLKNLFLITIMAVAMVSCGGDSKNEEPEDPTSDQITRVKDGNGEVFLENGQLVVANTSFSTNDLQNVLTATDWKCDYYLIYDNKHISSKMTEPGYQMLTALHTDMTAQVSSLGKLNYTLSGRTLTVVNNPLSSTMLFNRTYVVVALDYTDARKRLVIDCPKVSGVDIPADYDSKSMSARLVLTPKE